MRMNLVVFALLALLANANYVSNFFHNDMVLQHDGSKLFGWARDTSGKGLTVKFDIKLFNDVSGRVTAITATSNADSGFWTADVPAYVPKSGTAESLTDTHTLLITPSAYFDPINFTGILFGTVFLCGGQSNMASIGVRHAENNEPELERTGAGVILARCRSHSYQGFQKISGTNQLTVNSRCLTSIKEPAALDTIATVTLADCAHTAEAAEAAGQVFSFDETTGRITGTVADKCLRAYVEGWSWDRCQYAEPNVEWADCCDEPYCLWHYNTTTGHITNNANDLCLTGVGERGNVDDIYDQMRIFRTEFDYTDNELEELRNIATHWTKPTVSTLAKFSAVCWYMGRDFYESQKAGEKRPVGLVESAVSGSYIEAWSSKEVLDKCPCHEGSWGGGNSLSVLWNAMIAPITYSAVGAMSWYQAESNLHLHTCYKCLFPALISEWRTRFPKRPSGKTVPFVYVEITPRSLDPDFDAAELRLAQDAALSLDAVGKAATQDLGDAESIFNTEHPRLKKPIGERLSMKMRYFINGENLPLANVGIKNVTLDSGNKKVLLTFLPNTIGKNFTLSDRFICPVASTCCADSAFEVMGKDGKWYAASVSRLPPSYGFGVVITPGSTFPATETVASVRYLYAQWPVPVIFNEIGIPMSPFVYDFGK